MSGGTAIGSERDLDQNPYSPDEQRIAEFLFERGAGGGDDPVGFILSSYAYLVEQRNTLREALNLARGDMQRAIAEIDRELKSDL
jgi:hypothetical protein